MLLIFGLSYHSETIENMKHTCATINSYHYITDENITAVHRRCWTNVVVLARAMQNIPDILINNAAKILLDDKTGFVRRKPERSSDKSPLSRLNSFRKSLKFQRSFKRSKSSDPQAGKQGTTHTKQFNLNTVTKIFKRN